jgi:hypothetical protein
MHQNKTLKTPIKTNKYFDWKKSKIIMQLILLQTFSSPNQVPPVSQNQTRKPF